MIGWFAHRQEIRSIIGWGSLFFAAELAAHYQASRLVAAVAVFAAAGIVVAMWPIFTLSGTGWNGIAWWSFVGVLIGAFTFILLGHFEWHWSARWLIGFAVMAAGMVVSHAVEKTLT